MSTSTLTSKGQITIPREVRERLHVAAGDRLSWEVQGDGSVVVRKERRCTVAEMAGLLGKPDRSVSVEEMDAAIAEHLRDKHRARR